MKRPYNTFWHCPGQRHCPSLCGIRMSARPTNLFNEASQVISRTRDGDQDRGRACSTISGKETRNSPSPFRYRLSPKGSGPRRREKASTV